MERLFLGENKIIGSTIQMVEVGKRNPTNYLIQSYLKLKNDSQWKLNKVWKDTR